MATTEQAETNTNPNLDNYFFRPQSDAVEEVPQEEPEAEAPQDAPEVSEAAQGDADDGSPDTDDDGTEDADPQAPQTFAVKVDGKDVEVTLDDLKRSYSGQGYIQKGMQEAADARKQAQAMIANLQAEQAKFLEAVQAVQQQGLISPPQKPDPKMLDTDPIGYMRDVAEYDRKAGEYRQQQAQLQQVEAQRKALEDAKYQEYVAEQVATLTQKIPEFADPQKAVAMRDKLIKAGMEAYGFSAGEMGGIDDARQVEVLYDAMKWRELQAGKAAAKKAPEAPRNVKPQARRPEPPQLSRARTAERMKATKGENLDDFAAYLRGK